MRINTNVSALNAFRNLSTTQNALSSSMEKLSSGFRINKASDDAAGLAIANKLRAEGRALQTASRNAEQASSMLQIMDGATQTVSSILDRMKELATQANSDNIGSQRQKLQDEFNALHDEIQRLADTTTYQGKQLVAGSFGNSVNSSSTALTGSSVVYDVNITGAGSGSYTLGNATAGKLTLTDGSTTQSVDVATDGKQSVSFSQFGITLDLTAAYDAGATTNALGNITVDAGSSGGSFMVSSSGHYNGQDLISLSSIDLTTSGLAIDSLDLSSDANAQSALTAIDTAIDSVNTYVGKLGAAESRISFASQSVQTAIVNTQAAESTIRDVDMAQEMTTFSKNQILQQAGTAMLAQANQMGQSVLKLLQ